MKERRDSIHLYFDVLVLIDRGYTSPNRLGLASRMSYDKLVHRLNLLESFGMLHWTDKKPKIDHKPTWKNKPRLKVTRKGRQFLLLADEPLIFIERLLDTFFSKERKRYTHIDPIDLWKGFTQKPLTKKDIIKFIKNEMDVKLDST